MRLFGIDLDKQTIHICKHCLRSLKPNAKPNGNESDVLLTCIYSSLSDVVIFDDECTSDCFINYHGSVNELVLLFFREIDNINWYSNRKLLNKYANDCWEENKVKWGVG